MSEIKVTFAALGAAQTDLAGAAGNISRELDDLKRFLAPLVSTWTGQAAEAYGNTQRQWDVAAIDLHQVLLEAAAFVGHAEAAYRANEVRVGNLFPAG